MIPMADDDAPSIEPADQVEADQVLVAGDRVFVEAVFERISHDGVYVRLAHPSRVRRGLPFQSVVVDPAAVLAPLQIARLLKAYGQ